MATASRKIGKVSVLAFEKKLVPSDGYMHGTTWDKRSGHATPLALIEKSVRGTISNRLSKALQDDPAKLDAKVESPNLQTVDVCALGQDQDTLKLSFTLKILSGVEHPSACNNAEFKQSYTKVARAYAEKYNFTELATRYASNIANARFLWRNRVGAENLEVSVKVLSGGSNLTWIFNAAKIPLRSFEANDLNIRELAKHISHALTGQAEFLTLEITAYAQVGKSQEVYPSEELVLDKGNSKSKKSKILYAVNGNAAMHSQKIGNALRTIDTWYPKYEEFETGPIAIEAYGAVTNLGVAYRKPSDKADFYTLFDKYARGDALANEAEEHYVMAVLVRGGVFGESDKE
ncbi:MULTISPECIES: type I-F CRISPR-associated protein Csy3 [unclassified Undibacterium]|uniref:type I-F CRISPR-associated protein Csy3 n=1 Tax=unclassified Undibacterium TaxID=2630295 RepID=UPI002AC8F688|nr:MULTISPECIES: type I-F CRISPR-associated protein Csy3 [unclassified Undibacterium]MEB0139124.1 type I-F CRISPR-associated protein Csy3 [Undibacterium sp. CCC2.1]MEB0172896.1 type I-F CRISPR-associated protein Csy3 [Undibacterium sp. CCC1.1]MEB0176632.1 type I-F CRISPR-associated protein Csy3 [Undibacterium sp. CCC3.4]MEB0216040.1 type I-F CRISPR-associated protein Csy3 [Undibacterium sp. 5I2]WPX43119.1 type I-F CRISPR-associated protein Csy3 [Undibacterium sp. CCC3.4]